MREGGFVERRGPVFHGSWCAALNGAPSGRTHPVALVALLEALTTLVRRKSWRHPETRGHPAGRSCAASFRRGGELVDAPSRLPVGPRAIRPFEAPIGPPSPSSLGPSHPLFLDWRFPRMGGGYQLVNCDRLGRRTARAQTAYLSPSITSRVAPSQGLHGRPSRAS